MIISSIKLHNFRNYDGLDMAPGEGVNVIMGANAQGKTNILEAVHICCLGKSHRANRDAELIQRGHKSAYIRVDSERRDGPRGVEVLMEGGRKKICVSGVPIRRMAELMGHVNCVMFSPEDLYLVKGGPGLRRRFMDSTLCQTDAAYYSALTTYNGALSQRNALLRTPKPDTAMMDLFEDTMAKAGKEVMLRREAFLRGLATAAEGIHSGLTKGEAISLQYRQSLVSDGVEGFKDALVAGREDDMRRLTTCRGPHRDDVGIAIDGLDTRTYASQGQQRTAALSIKLAGADMMRAETGERPVILLDDVMSELDEARQQALLERVAGQVFITTATSPPQGLGGAELFSVEGGVLQRTQ